MIIDTSAIMSILLEEPDAPVFARAMATGGMLRISAGTLIELTAVIVRRAPHLKDIEPERAMATFRIEIVPVSAIQTSIAQTAYRTYGRGTGHAAGLNFGDCFAYTLSKQTGEPLLFKGNDFTHTDIIAAIS